MAGFIYKNKGNKIAFTLAEVLITIVVIGIVASVTLPSVVLNYRKKQTVVKLKKEYQTFAEAINHAIKDYGPISTWELQSNNQIVADYIKPYLKVKDKKYGDRYQYKYLNGSSNYFVENSVYFLENGTAFTVGHNATPREWYGIRLYVDINGTKKPNIFGKDIFVFTIKSSCYGVKNAYLNKLVPEGIECSRTEKNREQLFGDYGSCTKEQGVSLAGLYCAAVIIRDGWEIKDDYPW